MAINFTNADLLSISQQPIKFDSDLKFANHKGLEVSGNLIDLSNDNGIETLSQEINSLIEVDLNSLGSSNNSLQEIIINGISYGDGVVESIDFNGDQIQTAVYNAKISITEAGNLSDLILPQNESTPTSTNIYSELNLSDSILENEDLKHLTNFSENFNFSLDKSGDINVSHEIACSFNNRKSLMSSQKGLLFTGASLQDLKLKNLKNKGKGSIKVNSGSSATHTLTLQVKSDGAPQRYTLFFDYLGQDSISYGAASINFEGQIMTLGSSLGRKKIEVEVTASGLKAITLISNQSNNTFFDNFKLYKSDELPIEKSRALVGFLFENSPNYSIIEAQHEGAFKNLSLFQNVQKEETFDEINFNYSASRQINYGALSENKKHSVVSNISLSLTSEGFIELSESSNIKALEDKSELNLRDIVSSVEIGAYSRCFDFINKYNSYFASGCELFGPSFPGTITPTETLTPNLFLESITNAKSFNFFEGTASLNLSFTNDPSFVKDSSNKAYIHQEDESIDNTEGNFDLTLSGRIQGGGENSADRNTNSEYGLTQALLNVLVRLNDIQARYSIPEDFNMVEKSINKDNSMGSISYSLKYSNKKSYQSYPLTGTPLIKKYEIKVSNEEAVRIFNEFNVNCKVVPQFLKNLKSQKGVTVNIEVNGFNGVGVVTLLNLSKEILINKNLMYGIGSDDQIPPTSLKEFISEESFSYSNSKNSLSYTRSIIDVNSCHETPTSTSSTVYLHDWEVTPETPTVTPITNLQEQYIEPTQTPETSTIYIYFTPEPVETFTNFSFQIFGTNTETATFYSLPSPAVETSTITIPPTVQQTSYLQEIFIPKNYDGTISNLCPEGIIKSGKYCFDADSPSSMLGFSETNISISYAQSIKPKDCEYSHSSFPGDVSFYSFTFEIPISVQTPTDAREYPYEYHRVNIPEFWEGSISELVQNSANKFFIGGYRSQGNFQYGNINSENPINMNSKLSNLSEYNNSHPNYNDSEVYQGLLIYKSLNVPTPNVNYTVNNVLIPESSAEKLKGLYTPTSINYKIIGYEQCNGVVRFNEVLTPTSTQDSELLNYNDDEIIDTCNELSSNRQLRSIFIKEL